MYTEEQFKRHSEYIQIQLADCSNEDRNDVVRLLRMNWPDDKTVEGYVKNKKAEIAKRASPEELEEVFKYMF